MNKLENALKEIQKLTLDPKTKKTTFKWKILNIIDNALNEEPKSWKGRRNEIIGDILSTQAPKAKAKEIKVGDEVFCFFNSDTEADTDAYGTPIAFTVTRIEDGTATVQASAYYKSEDGVVWNEPQPHWRQIELESLSVINR